ncbi:MAG: hypothetical protein AAFO69_17690, partial [Bacteroidota bacterium]
NGKIHKSYPTPNCFNHIIVQTNIQGKDYYLDATNSYLPFGYLPTYSESLEALALKEELSWYLTRSLPNGKETIFQQLTFHNGNLERTYSIKWDALQSAEFRQKIGETGSAEMLLQMLEKPDRAEVKTNQVTNEKEHSQALNSRISFQERDFIKGQNKLYLEPIQYKRLIENPFSDEKRNYPVIFESLIKTQMTSIM